MDYLEISEDKDFTKKVLKLHKTISIMEKSKYLEPYFSNTFSNLRDYLLSFYV